jgi:hypothetical protein
MLAPCEVDTGNTGENRAERKSPQKSRDSGEVTSVSDPGSDIFPS